MCQLFKAVAYMEKTESSFLPTFYPQPTSKGISNEIFFSVSGFQKKKKLVKCMLYSRSFCFPASAMWHRKMSVGLEKSPGNRMVYLFGWLEAGKIDKLRI